MRTGLSQREEPAGLVNTILGTASGARNIGTNGALAIGGYIALAGLWAEPISGASMNPAYSRRFLPEKLADGTLTAAAWKTKLSYWCHTLRLGHSRRQRPDLISMCACGADRLALFKMDLMAATRGFCSASFHWPLIEPIWAFWTPQSAARPRWLR